MFQSGVVGVDFKNAPTFDPVDRSPLITGKKVYMDFKIIR